MKDNNENNGNGADGFDVDQFFKVEASDGDLELMERIKRLQEKYEVLELDYKEKGKELNRLKAQLADSWSLKQIKSMEVGGYKFQLKPFEDFSITRKGEPDAVKQERILALEPFFQQLGLDVVKHDAVSIHPQTLKSTFRKIFDPNGEFKLDLQETLDTFPFVNHHVGSVIKVEKVK